MNDGGIGEMTASILQQGISLGANSRLEQGRSHGWRISDAPLTVETGPAFSRQKNPAELLPMMLETIGGPKTVAALAQLDRFTNWEKRPRSGTRGGLEPMRDLATWLNKPHLEYRGAIDIEGTKGKISACALRWIDSFSPIGPTRSFEYLVNSR